MASTPCFPPSIPQLGPVAALQFSTLVAVRSRLGGGAFMIDALFWYTGLVAWVLIVFACPRAGVERYVLQSGCTSGPGPARGVRQAGISGRLPNASARSNRPATYPQSPRSGAFLRWRRCRAPAARA